MRYPCPAESPYISGDKKHIGAVVVTEGQFAAFTVKHSYIISAHDDKSAAGTGHGGSFPVFEV